MLDVVCDIIGLREAVFLCGGHLEIVVVSILPIYEEKWVLKTFVNCRSITDALEWAILEMCYVQIRPDPDVPREDKKTESGGQLSTVHTRTRAGETSSRTEETKDGRSRAGGSERSKEPQTEMREK